MTAINKKCLSNILAIIDNNGLKAMDAPSCAKTLEPIAERWRAFGWQVREIDGHNMAEICAGLDWAEGNQAAPSLLVAIPSRGKGISYMEGNLPIITRC